MVLYKYCPKCYSLNVGVEPGTMNHKCRQCSFVGIMSQDSIDKINVMKKSKDIQRSAAAYQGSRTNLRTGGPGNDCEVIRKRDDPFNDEIESIETPQGNYKDEDFEDGPEENDLESRQSNIMKKRAIQEPVQRHGLSPKSNLSTKERLKAKGGKDWDLV